MLDVENNSESEWGKSIVRVTEFAQDTASGFAAQYNETAWFPVAQNAISNYFEVSFGQLPGLRSGIARSRW